ncbi:hypothetical protein M2T82_18155 [Elizabethkingia ursingii]|uniref:hypothetical protein n=1 Tax=Elizabethkingia ursingii TaxID=1756150 RepID=UPI002011E82E|nr:hypothetical protein [Elizabethkingia ursingii]MCL1669989.1 hypothetical protein [Elizabethkingia ursingii]
MKKQAINKKLLFKKEIVQDLHSFIGGQLPYSQKVDTYKCPAGSIDCVNDPVPNKYTCDCGNLIESTAGCATIRKCDMLDTLLARCR